MKPDERERCPKAIEVDAHGSERDEPGCLRFNVLQDEQGRPHHCELAPDGIMVHGAVCRPCSPLASLRAIPCTRGRCRYDALKALTVPW